MPCIVTRLGLLGVSFSANFTTFNILQSVRGQNVANALALRAGRFLKSPDSVTNFREARPEAQRIWRYGLPHLGFWSPHGVSGASSIRTTCCKHERKPDCSAEAFAQLDSLIKGVQGLQLALLQGGLVRILTLR